MQFQPKVIIGSLVGFIATAIGIIAVFFPSLFNLETKKIDNFTITLSSEDDYEKLIKFLIDHQNTIVSLNISYFENKRYEYKEDKNGNYTKYDFDDYETGDRKGKYGHATIDDDGKFYVSSEFIIPFNFDNLFRMNGGIGIWLKNNTENLSDHKSYFIMISRNSDKNKLYKWSFKNSNNRREMNINGVFFINKIIQDDEYASEIPITMSPQWNDIMCAEGGGDKCYPIDIIDLEPLSKKEIESKKY